MISLTLGLAGTACAKGSRTEASDSAPVTNAPQTSTTTSTTAPRKPCTEANLEEAAAVDYPEPTISDKACSSAAAVATLESSKVPGGIGVAFLKIGDDGRWVLLKVWNPAEAEAAVPEGIPASLVATWRANHDATQAAKNTTTTTIDPNAPSLYEGQEQTTTTTAPPPPECPPDTPPEQCTTTTEAPAP